MAIKVTYGFYATLTGDRRASWTESRWLPGGNALDGTSDAACISLARARLAMMAGNVYSLMIRQSLFVPQAVTGRMISQRQRNRIIVPSSAASGLTVLQTNLTAAIAVDYPAQGGYALMTASQPKECIQAAVDGQISGGGRTSANLYLAGNPDVLVGTGAGGTIFFGAVPNWIENFNFYLARLQIGGWAFLGTTTPPTSGQKDILSWSNEAAAPNRLQATINGQLSIGGTPVGVGMKVHVRGIRNAIPRSPRAVRIWRIAGITGPDTLGNYTYTLANSSAFTGTDIVSNGTLESVTSSFFNFLGTGTPLRAATHKRGGSLGAYRGRSQPRQRQLA